MRRMGHTLEFVKSVAKTGGGNAELELGSLEPGFYQVKIWNLENEKGYVTYLELNEDRQYTYEASIPMIDDMGATVTANASLYYTGLLNKIATLYIDNAGSISIWEDENYTFVVDIYRVR